MSLLAFIIFCCVITVYKYSTAHFLLCTDGLSDMKSIWLWKPAMVICLAPSCWLLSKADIYFWVEQRRQKRRKIDVLLQFLYVLMKFTLPADEVTYIFIFSLQMIEVRYQWHWQLWLFRFAEFKKRLITYVKKQKRATKIRVSWENGIC